MLSKIEKLIRAYTIRIRGITKELEGLARDRDCQARLALLRKQGVYINVVNDLREIIK